MASLSYLQPYLADTQAKAIEFDVSSHVVDALLALLQGASLIDTYSTPSYVLTAVYLLQNLIYLVWLIILFVHSISSLPL
jgi:hypothetical protein